MPLQSALLRTILSASETSTYAGDELTFQPNIDLSTVFTSGDDADEAENIGVLEATVTTSAADFDLTTARGPFSAEANNVIPFTGARGLLIVNNHATATLHWGKGTTNGWGGPIHSGVAAGTLVMSIPPLQHQFFTAADLPWVIGGSAKTIRMAASTGSISAYVWLLGNIG